MAALSSRPSQLSAGEALGRRNSQTIDRATPESVDAPIDRVWRPSVWFNPWHHQTGEQVWAGLASSIIDEVTGRMSTIDRERFFFRLNLARINRESVRRTLYQTLWRRLAPALMVLTATSLFVATTWSARWATSGFSLASLAAIAAATMSMLRSPVNRLYPSLVTNPTYPRFAGDREDIAGLGTLVNDPSHAANVGYAYLTYVDLKRVIDLIAKPSRPLVIFIDDLDRCSPSVVVQLLEALNLFLAGPFNNCTFVMAIEPTMLVAHIGSAYEPLVRVLATTDTTAADDHRSLGWRFLEKMVQLPVVVPRPTRDQATHYLTSLLPNPDDSVAARRQPEAASSRFTPEIGDSSLDREPSTTDGTSSVRQPQRDRQDMAQMVVDSGAERRDTRFTQHRASEEAAKVRFAPAQERFARNLASDPAFHQACTWSAYNLIPSLNPRQLKRLLAMIELYTLMANRLGYLKLDDPATLTTQIEEIGVLAALNIRWPHLVDQLLAPEPDDPHGLLVIDQLRQDMKAPDELTVPAATKSLPADLRQFLQEHHRFLSMASRLTTLEPATAVLPEHS